MEVEPGVSVLFEKHYGDIFESLPAIVLIKRHKVLLWLMTLLPFFYFSARLHLSVRLLLFFFFLKEVSEC